jgi:hypothetical protein
LHKPEAFKDQKTFTMLRTLMFDPFKARISCMEEMEKEVVISVTENFK